MDSLFTISLEVRDHECDIQGIVNNSVYLNYLEHGRHKMLKTLGIDFSTLAREGVNLVIIRNVVNYKFPLQSGDEFRVTTRLSRESRLKIRFDQTIRRTRDQRLIVTAEVTGAAIDRAHKPLRLDKIPALAVFAQLN
jgi:acyl-CoA thioester hydrolase